ncbi:MAG: c-type cytochrome [Variovorax sp.]
MESARRPPAPLSGLFGNLKSRCVPVLLAWGLGAASHAAPAAPTRVPDTLEQRVAVCIACHGREGASTNAGYFPRLAGKPAGYLFNQLVSFRDGRRFNADMTHLVQHLSDPYLREMAGYFAALELPYPAVTLAVDVPEATLQRGRALVFEGDGPRAVPACVQCHGKTLTGVQPGIPALVGLPRLYIALQLNAWLTDDRHALAPDCMADVARRLTPADINAVAGWLASQPLPASTKPLAALPGPLPRPCSAMAN